MKIEGNDECEFSIVSSWPTGLLMMKPRISRAEIWRLLADDKLAICLALLPCKIGRRYN
jgi:hypothetical protein